MDAVYGDLDGLVGEDDASRASRSSSSDGEDDNSSNPIGDEAGAAWEAVAEPDVSTMYVCEDAFDQGAREELCEVARRLVHVFGVEGRDAGEFAEHIAVWIRGCKLHETFYVLLSGRDLGSGVVVSAELVARFIYVLLVLSAYNLSPTGFYNSAHINSEDREVLDESVFRQCLAALTPAGRAGMTSRPERTGASQLGLGHADASAEDAVRRVPFSAKAGYDIVQGVADNSQSSRAASRSRATLCCRSTTT